MSTAEPPKAPLPPPPGKLHYGSSVAPSGTVYLGRSGTGCGNHVELWRYPLDGAPTLLVTFRRGQDFRFSYVNQTAADATAVYFDRVVCRKKAWDIYKIVDRPPPLPARQR